MRDRPATPIRDVWRTATMPLNNENGARLSDIIERTHPDAYLEIGYQWDDVPDIMVRYPDPETEEEFTVRRAKYEAELAAYNSWLVRHKDLQEQVSSLINRQMAKMLKKLTRGWSNERRTNVDQSRDC